MISWFLILGISFGAVLGAGVAIYFRIRRQMNTSRSDTGLESSARPDPD
jgi:hypothetical protein